MKRLLLIVMGVLLCTPLYSDMNPYIYGVTVASAPARSCQEASYMGSTSTSDSWVGIGSDNGNYYRGVIFQTAAKSVCKVTAVVKNYTGTTTGKTFTCRIWALDGSSFLDTELGVSDTESGGDFTSATTLTFNFSPPVSLSASTNYAITLDTGSTDASNFAQLLGTETAISNFGVARWLGPAEDQYHLGSTSEADPSISLFSFE